MVFAAGLGTRLRPLTDRLPKPVVPLMNRPLARYAMDRLRAAGATHLALNTHYLADAVREELALDAEPEALEVREPTLLGTGGGLKNAMRALVARFGERPEDEPVLVMNADILFWPDLEAALAHHRALGAHATMVLRPDPEVERYGALGLDPEGRVRQLLGRPERTAGEPPLRARMFTGVHVLSWAAIRDLPEEGCIVRLGYRRWIDDEATVVAGVVEESPWRDLGTPAQYLGAHLDLLRGRLRWPGEPPTLSQNMDRSNLVDPSAEVEGAELEEAIIGAGARVEPGIRLERVVVWPGTHVRENARDAVLAPHARVDAG